MIFFGCFFSSLQVLFPINGLFYDIFWFRQFCRLTILITRRSDTCEFTKPKKHKANNLQSCPATQPSACKTNSGLQNKQTSDMRTRFLKQKIGFEPSTILAARVESLPLAEYVGKAKKIEIFTDNASTTPPPPLLFRQQKKWISC